MNLKLKDSYEIYRDMIIISLISIPIGAVVGAIDAVFGRVLLFITAFRGEHVLPLVPFLALAGLIVVCYYRRWGLGTEKGMGLIFEAGYGEAHDIPLRLVPFVTVGTWLTHLFGGSAGREGVAVQIGATVSHWVGKKVPIKNSSRIFLVVGMAAGFSGLFRTPIAATFFALEVLISGALIYKALLPAMLAAYTASAVSGMLGLEKFTFDLAGDLAGAGAALGGSPLLFVKLVALGIIFGVVGGAFAASLKWLKRKLGEKIADPRKRIVIVGVIISALVLLLHCGRYAGLGTNLISASFAGETIYGYDWILKFLLTIITLAAGYQGGEVTPLFSIGASLGTVLGGLFGLPASFVAALGYTAVFGGASNTLLAPMIIGVEVFGFAYLPYFFITCAFAFWFNNAHSIYGKQRHNATDL